MALQALAVAEASLDVLDQRFFLRCKLIGILRIYRRQVDIFHIVGFAVQRDLLILIINLIQKQAIIHIEFRMTLDQLSYQLELQDSNCLLHLHVERQVRDRT